MGEGDGMGEEVKNTEKNNHNVSKVYVLFQSTKTQNLKAGRCLHICSISTLQQDINESSLQYL